jgi:Carboxypeptidase regulatory-like domain/TonB dependent receptor
MLVRRRVVALDTGFPGRKVRLVLALLCAGSVLADRCVWAQTAVDGAIRGVVRDAGGAVVPDANVRVDDSADGVHLIAVTQKDGAFVLLRVPAGVYAMTVEASGFRQLVREVDVAVGGVTEVEARLKGPGITTVVTVSGQQESGPAALTSSVTPDEIERLSVNGRRWQTFALLTPGVNPSGTDNSLLSFRGSAVTQNSYSLDGGSDEQSFGGVPRGAAVDDPAEEEAAGVASEAGSRSGTIAGGYGRHAGAAYTFSQEAVREFRVNGQNYSALYGRGVGGVVTTASKSGTDQIHGSAFYLLRESALGAANPFSVETHYVNGVVTSEAVKPHDLRQQFGGSIGGPTVKDKIFYFYTFDQQRRGFPAVSAPGYAGFYSLTPTQTALLGNRGVTSSAVNAALNYLDSLTGLVPRRQDQTVNFGKVDWAASTRSRWSLEYNRARVAAPAGARSAAVLNRGTASLGNTFTKVDSVLGRWLWMPSATLSHELRVHYGRDFQYETAQAPLPQEPAVGPAGLAPEIAIDPQGLIFGTPASLSRRAYPDERRIEVADLVSWSRGPHLLQIGADVSWVHDFVDALSNVEGTFSYDSGVTNGRAGGLVDWITDYTFNVHAYPNGGCPSITASVHDFCFRSYTQSFGQQTVAFDTQEWAGFAQDEWRVGERLTVNAGVRYEYELLPLPQKPNAALDAVFGARGATSVFPEDRNNFGPRVGVAWQPFGAGRGVVRVGYGLYYGRLPGATVRSALVNTGMASTATHVKIVPGTITYCPQVANQGFGYACSYTSAPPAAVAVTTSADVFDRRFRLPMVQQGSFGVERELWRGLTASATYLMNLDRQLPSSVDINVAPSVGMGVFQLVGGTGAAGVRDGETFQLPVYTQRVSANFGPVTDIVSDVGATYHALVLEERQRGSKSLEFRVNWTWSKAIDYGQSGGAVPRTNAQLDPFNLGYDKGLSALNYPHRVVASAVWEPIFSTERRWLRRVGSGWMVAPIFTERSGRPYSYDIFGGSRLSGGHESINGAGGAVYLPTVGRDTLRLPDAVNVDVRVSRVVRVAERVRVRGTVEVFNVANHVNYSGVTTRAFLVGTAVNRVTPLVFQDANTVAAEGLNVRPFGAFTEASAGGAQERQVQLGLRLEF